MKTCPLCVGSILVGALALAAGCSPFGGSSSSTSSSGGALGSATSRAGSGSGGDSSSGGDGSSGGTASSGGSSGDVSSGPLACGDHTTCGTCTNTQDCGFCTNTNVCGIGTRTGPTAGGCSEADGNWSWYFNQCPGVDAGQAACDNTSTCAACTPVSGCGFCSNGAGCLPGGFGGPHNTACTLANWAFNPGECQSPDGG